MNLCQLFMSVLGLLQLVAGGEMALPATKQKHSRTTLQHHSHSQCLQHSLTRQVQRWNSTAGLSDLGALEWRGSRGRAVRNSGAGRLSPRLPWRLTRLKYAATHQCQGSWQICLYMRQCTWSAACSHIGKRMQSECTKDSKLRLSHSKFSRLRCLKQNRWSLMPMDSLPSS